jgi:hypothetical protein
MRALAQRLSGRLIEATTWSESVYAHLLALRSAPPAAAEASLLGLIWLARGRVRTALRFCRESAALLRDGDAVGMLALALAGVGQAAAQPESRTRRGRRYGRWSGRRSATKLGVTSRQELAPALSSRASES